MSFVSPEFLVFFVVAVAAYFATPFKYRWVFLLAASYFFYIYWNTRLIFLILASTIIDYGVARFIAATPPEQRRRRTLWLLLSLVSNLGILFTFKYYNFFVFSANDTLMALGFDSALEELNVLLPVGISFYTFQSLSYTIDVYRGDHDAEKHFGIFALYIAFFPQLVAGPIERASNMLAQFREQHDFDYERVVIGLRIALWGFFKKVVIADRLAPYVNSVYNDVDEHSGVVLIIATIFFAIQIYCDFSGYSDIAIGTAKVMGFNLMENFRQPYLATSVREFWGRWHISLSTWFRDYLYIPLGGNRLGFSRMLINLMIVFVVSGLWHGANWTFVVWGALHGLYIVYERIWVRWEGRPRSPVIVRWAGTTLLVLIAWVFFRANNMGDAVYVLRESLNFSEGFAQVYAPFASGTLDAELSFILAWAAIGALAIFDFVDNRVSLLPRLNRIPAPLRWATYYVLIVVIYLSLVFGSVVEDFIYFQF
jgi:D-alanyl-lipoteichoic acid acyltransferase DltB (MBOAT superfamily)